jgi:membrane associated rhomboid family serine protease
MPLSDSQADDAIECIRGGLSHAAALDLALVLAAVGIGHRVVHASDGSSLWVKTERVEAALAALAAYERENVSTEDRRERVRPNPRRNWAGVGLALFILAVHVAASGDGDHGAYVPAYGASAEQILAGEFYRTVTALILHADWGHLAANMAGCVIFATAVCAWIGSGVGVLLILAAGVAGNWVTAVVYQGGHTAIGASTAVFGALGLIAAHQFIEKIRVPGQRMRAWLPIAGALALLGFLGVSERSDLLAHFFGLLAGLVMGAIANLTLPRPPGASVQNACLVLVFTIVAAAWFTGFG